MFSQSGYIARQNILLVTWIMFSQSGHLVIAGQNIRLVNLKH